MADMWVLNTGWGGADHGLPGGQPRLHHPRHHHTLHFLPLVSHLRFSFFSSSFAHSASKLAKSAVITPLKRDGARDGYLFESVLFVCMLMVFKIFE